MRGTFLSDNIIELILLKHLYNSTDDSLNMDNAYFEQIVSHLYPTELQLNK